TADPPLAVARDELLADLRRALGGAEGHVSSPEERALVDDIGMLLDLYLQQRTELEAEDIGIEEMLQLTQPSSERIVEALEALHDLNEAQVLLAQSDSMRWSSLVNAFSGAAA